MRKSTIILSAGAFAVVMVLFGLLVKGLMIPTGTVTRGRMITIKHVIKQYEKEHGKLPENLDGFRNFNKNCDITKDEWDRQIIYDANSQGSITLTSLGRDGKPGGKGKNCDIVFHFKTGDSKVTAPGAKDLKSSPLNRRRRYTC
jgi:hypothetical protein